MLWRVLDRSRSLLLGWGLACLAAFALLALAVTQGWGPLADVDARGGGPDAPYVEAGSRLFDLLRWIELTFGTTGIGNTGRHNLETGHRAMHAILESPRKRDQIVVGAQAFDFRHDTP